MPSPALDAGKLPARVDAGAAAHFDTGPCLTPQAAKCTCEDGRDGMRKCTAGFPTGNCMCSGPPKTSDEQCVPGERVACTCGDGSDSFRICGVLRTLGACVCAPPCARDVDAGDDSDAGECEPPRCVDADAFDGVCPSDPVRGASDVRVGSVYLRASPSPGNCDTLLIPFFPLDLRSAYGGLDCRSRAFRFGGDSDEIYFLDTMGLVQRDDQGQEWLWPTPGCTTLGDFRFFTGRTYAYACSRTIYYADGSTLASDVDGIVLAMGSDDGRVLAVVHGSTSDAVVVYDAPGHSVARLAPGELTGDRFTLLPAAATRAGSNAYVLFDRGSDLANSKHELVGYRLDVGNRWTTVRRIARDQASGAAILLPDGTVLSVESDPAMPGKKRVQVWLADGSAATAWRDADHGAISIARPELLLIGPELPKGSSVESLDGR